MPESRCRRSACVRELVSSHYYRKCDDTDLPRDERRNRGAHGRVARRCRSASRPGPGLADPPGCRPRPRSGHDGAGIERCELPALLPDRRARRVHPDPDGRAAGKGRLRTVRPCAAGHGRGWRQRSPDRSPGPGRRLPAAGRLRQHHLPVGPERADRAAPLCRRHHRADPAAVGQPARAFSRRTTAPCCCAR